MRDGRGCFPLLLGKCRTRGLGACGSGDDGEAWKQISGVCFPQKRAIPSSTALLIKSGMVIEQHIHKVEERRILGKCFEYMSLLAKFVGRAAFHADAHAIMQCMIQSVQVE